MLIRGDRQQIVDLIRNNTMCTITSYVFLTLTLSAEKY